MRYCKYISSEGGALGAYGIITENPIKIKTTTINKNIKYTAQSSTFILLLFRKTVTLRYHDVPILDIILWYTRV